MTLAFVLTAEARALIDAFRATEQAEMVGALIIDEGFSAEAVRVVVAWMNSSFPWKTPSRAIPDDGRPTAKAWAWLVSGLDIDYVAIADAADVSTATARSKVALLLGTRVVYPDGSVAKVAKAAIQAAVQARVKQSKQPQEKAKPKTEKPGGAN